LVYLETPDREVILYERKKEIEKYVEDFQNMRQLATAPERLRDVIDSILKSPSRDLRMR
jgi:hypothetical protein